MIFFAVEGAKIFFRTCAICFHERHFILKYAPKVTGSNISLTGEGGAALQKRSEKPDLSSNMINSKSLNGAHGSLTSLGFTFNSLLQ